MQIEVAFVNLERSEAVEAGIRNRAEKLQRFHPDIGSCHVWVEAVRRRRSGNRYVVRVEARVPGFDLTINGKAHARATIEVPLAVRAAFDAMQRRLKRHKRTALSAVSGR